MFEDLPKVSKSTELDILCPLQTRYREQTTTMSHASAGLLEYAEASEAIAILDNRSPKLLSRMKYKPTETNHSNPEHQPGKYLEQVEIGASIFTPGLCCLEKHGSLLAL